MAHEIRRRSALQHARRCDCATGDFLRCFDVVPGRTYFFAIIAAIAIAAAGVAPKVGVKGFLEDASADLTRAVKSAALANMHITAANWKRLRRN